MELHTPDSLRRIHGIEIRPTKSLRRIYLPRFADFCRAAAKGRKNFLRKVCSVAAGGLVRTFGKLIVEPIRREMKYRNERSLPRRIIDNHGSVICCDAGQSARLGRRVDH